MLEVCYFKVADRFNIIDKPNERSSHTRIVLRLTMDGDVNPLVALWRNLQYLWYVGIKRIKYSQKE